MAAAKVFAVTEVCFRVNYPFSRFLLADLTLLPQLLENILHQLALLAVLSADGTTLEPITSMSLLPRANHTFNNTIKGSIMLQKAMFSESDEVTIDNLLYRSQSLGDEAKAQLLRGPPRLRPLEMLFRRLLGGGLFIRRRFAFERTRTKGSPAYYGHKESGIRIETRHGPEFGDAQMLMKRFLVSEDSNPVASWRTIEVKQNGITASEKVTFFTVVFRRPRTFKGKNWYSEELHLGEGCTLEQVFRKYVEIMERTQIQHMALARACTETDKGRIVRSGIVAT